MAPMSRPGAHYTVRSPLWILMAKRPETQLMDPDSPKPKKPIRKAKVLGVGEDSRNQYTVDADARAGRRSATNSRPAAPYVGYELHLAVQTRDVRWTNNVDRTTVGPRWPVWSRHWRWCQRA